MSGPAAAPSAVSEAVVDPDYPVTPVPSHAKKSFFSLMVVLLGFTIFTPTMLAGAQLGGRGSKLASLLLGGTQIGWYGM